MRPASWSLVRANLTRSVERVLERVEDIREHGVVFPTPDGGCRTRWVLGHLAYIEARVIRRFVLGGPSPLAHWEPLFDGGDPSGEVDV
jgi:hypothetical protein